MTGYLPGADSGERVLGKAFLYGADISSRWWELFRSRALNDLIEEGIVHNADLQAAEAAVRVAQANALAQRGALFPQVAANWNSIRQQVPIATLDSPAANNADDLQPAYRAGDASATWPTCGAARGAQIEVAAGAGRERRPSSAKPSISRSPPTSRLPPSRKRRCADRSRRRAG